MSMLSDVVAWWQANPNLQSVLPVGDAPAGKVWIGVAADGVQLPFVILDDVATVMYPTVCRSYYDESLLRLNVYAQTFSQAASLALTIANELDRVIITTGYMNALRNGTNTVADPYGAYHIVMEYSIMTNHETAH